MREAEREYPTMRLLLLIYSVSSKAEICPTINHLYNQSLDFFKWYFNEAMPEDLLSVDGSPLSYYDLEFLGRKWDEYIQIATEEE